MAAKADKILGWGQAVVLGAVPWLAAQQPWLAPAGVALAVLLHPPWRRHGDTDPWTGLVTAATALAAVAVAGATTEAAAWALLVAMVAGVSFSLRHAPTRRPDAADLVALLGFGGAFVLLPELLSPGRGGWVGPAVALVVARRLAPASRGRRSAAIRLGPPSCEVSGALRLAGLVAGDQDGVPRTAPLELELEPGESIAVVCDVPGDAEAIALTVGGRRAPAGGSVRFDGAPLAAGERVVAVVAPGEPFVAGGVDENLALLRSDRISRDTLLGVREACALDEVESELGGGTLDSDGAPLDAFHRLLLAVARVIPSEYRVVVIVDPMPWVNSVRAELWRAAVVRASLGRTALWLTPDRTLAARATRTVELRHGILRPTAHGTEGNRREAREARDG